MFCKHFEVEALWRVTITDLDPSAADVELGHVDGDLASRCMNYLFAPAASSAVHDIWGRSDRASGLFILLVATLPAPFLSAEEFSHENVVSVYKILHSWDEVCRMFSRLLKHFAASDRVVPKPLLAHVDGLCSTMRTYMYDWKREYFLLV